MDDSIEKSPDQKSGSLDFESLLRFDFLIWYNNFYKAQIISCFYLIELNLNVWIRNSMSLRGLIPAADKYLGMLNSVLMFTRSKWIYIPAHRDDVWTVWSCQHCCSPDRINNVDKSFLNSQGILWTLCSGRQRGFG